MLFFLSFVHVVHCGVDVLLLLLFFLQGNDTSTCDDGEPCQCSNDDWDCYRPAQQNVSAAFAVVKLANVHAVWWLLELL